MTRMYLRLGAALILLFLVAGCLINAPESEPPFYSYLKIQPDYNLQAAPEGQCYQLWAFDLDSNFQGVEFTPMQRFLWDPVNYQTLDVQGNPIPLYDPEGPGMDMGINVIGHVLIAITVEPINDPLPDIPQGPVLMFYLDLSAFGAPVPSLLAENGEVDLRLDQANVGIQEGPGVSYVSFLAQSTQYRRQMVEGEDVCWRDATSGTGLWFVDPTVVNRVVEDTAGYTADPEADSGDGTIYARNVDLDRNGRQYLIWVFPDHPESSWSNFDNVFPTRFPDLRFRDGVPIRPAGTVPPPSSGINRLGGNPIVRGGQTIGYMYFPDTNNAPNFLDTCFLRTDYPESTFCTQHPDSVYRYANGVLKPFDDVNYLVREFTTTWADTIAISSLLSLPVLPDDQIGLEWEAWLIFDSANNPVYPPLSLGRISANDRNFDGVPDGIWERDSSDPYTDEANNDPNIHFPGEDLLSGLPAPFPSPLDLFNFDGAEQIKLWITAEPVRDWDSSRPFVQMVTYAANLRPDTQEAIDSAAVQCAQRGVPGITSPYPVYSIPLRYRPRGLSRTDVVEGNNWPTVKIMVTDANAAALMK
ncbi:MAG: hypothetical protein AB1752_06990 [Candidatus Zixiibacteriota bacterium]